MVLEEYKLGSVSRLAAEPGVLPPSKTRGLIGIECLGIAQSALTTASVEMKWRNGWSVAATFDGEFSNVTNSCAGKGVVRYAW